MSELKTPNLEAYHCPHPCNCFGCAAIDDIETLSNMLKKLEWVYWVAENDLMVRAYRCPRCGNSQEKGHKKICDLAPLIDGKIEKEK